MPRITDLMPTAPARIRALPRDQRGYPIPKFVMWFDGKPEFRVLDNQYLARAINRRLCWVCGGPLGVHMTFVLGILSAVSGVSGEPPCHHECAEFAMRACPYLAHSETHRTLDDGAHGTVPLPGHVDYKGMTRLTWTTKVYRVFDPPGGGVLIRVGQPESVTWWADGRHATRSEVLGDLRRARPMLDAEQERQHLPPAALQQALLAVLKLLPPEE